MLLKMEEASNQALEAEIREPLSNKHTLLSR